MSLISTLARMEAVAAGRAQPTATVRHRWLAERPMVFVPLTTAGEAGAPLGALVGTDRAHPRLLTVPQPRDRDLRFAFLSALADEMLPHLESAQDDVEVEQRGDEETELCADAPQLLVPNGPALDFVRLLGRSMRFRRTAEEDPETPYPAPARVPLLGRWLTHYGERARVPGAALLAAMTDLLTRHWATGQSQLEDQHLGALLGWILPEERTRPEDPEARDGAGQLLHPPAGPATDPAFDNKLLAPAIDRYDAGLPGAAERIDELIASQLRPTWDDMWDGVELLRTLPEGGSVADRWKRDRYSYTHHRDRVRSGEPPQPKQDDAVTAAAKLASREQAQARLEAQEALDDPLAMAARRLAGEAFAGEVTEVVPEWSDGKRPRPRPLVTVRTGDRPHLTERGKVHRVLPEEYGGGRQSAEYVAHGPDDPGLITLRLVNGMGRGKEPAAGSVPEPGDRVCWTLFEHSPRGGPGLPEPEDTPWTHGGPPGDSPAAALPAAGAAPAGTAVAAPAVAAVAAAPDPETPEDFL
ncbi:hypothetical protein DVA86_29095 [Streptomyces armeniacus]|uniref:Uncharacterized protein n=1 Tax=Streptomyces armeniacus TaxID=83291 RepID=A0A345XWP3_9ACTN|nr:hypothetical protein [Streptomyces armeniacus]AXK36059.1 hypothetical protein DVA86_29095 [Streptomyces armeniacus]